MVLKHFSTFSLTAFNQAVCDLLLKQKKNCVWFVSPSSYACHCVGLHVKENDTLTPHVCSLWYHIFKKNELENYITFKSRSISNFRLIATTTLFLASKLYLKNKILSLKSCVNIGLFWFSLSSFIEFSLYKLVLVALTHT